MSSSAGKEDEGKEVDTNRMLEMRRCAVQAEEVGECCARVDKEIKCWKCVGVLAKEVAGECYRYLRWVRMYIEWWKYR